CWWTRSSSAGRAHEAGNEGSEGNKGNGWFRHSPHSLFPLFKQVLQLPEQLPERLRRLVLRTLVQRIAHQLPQALAVGTRMRLEERRQCSVAAFQQFFARGLGAMQQRGLPARGLAAGLQRVADRLQHVLVLAPHLLGEEAELALARDVRGDAARVLDV